MGFQDLSEIDFDEIDGYSHFMDEDFSTAYFQENPTHAKQLLQRFKDQTYY